MRVCKRGEEENDADAEWIQTLKSSCRSRMLKISRARILSRNIHGIAAAPVKKGEVGGKTRRRGQSLG